VHGEAVILSHLYLAVHEHCCNATTMQVRRSITAPVAVRPVLLAWVILNYIEIFLTINRKAIAHVTRHMIISKGKDSLYHSCYRVIGITPIRHHVGGLLRVMRVLISSKENKSGKVNALELNRVALHLVVSILRHEFVIILITQRGAL